MISLIHQLNFFDRRRIANWYITEQKVRPDRCCLDTNCFGHASLLLFLFFYGGWWVAKSSLVIGGSDCGQSTSDSVWCGWNWKFYPYRRRWGSEMRFHYNKNVCLKGWNRIGVITLPGNKFRWVAMAPRHVCPWNSIWRDWEIGDS